MQRLNFSLLILVTLLFAANAPAQQNGKAWLRPMNLLAGPIQPNGLPKGWRYSVEGSGKVDLSAGTLRFERDFPSDRCAIYFSKAVPDGTYLLTVGHTVDGNAPEIFLDNTLLGETRKLVVKGGEITFSLTIRGEGKVWGRFWKVSLVRQSQAKN